ncbi:ATP-binding protein [Sorangium sp. So ce1014]|uniref:nSTAND1 domain-containing NTPase n=1 Tax=Sorangium sp. So ce1014 TaxID=3133326 RepID=UPI003F5DC932
MTPSASARAQPYKSLDFFTDADAAVFAGREEEIDDVATRITASPTLVLYGPSGVGKTSLLCAGVVPTLEKERRYRAVYVRPLRSPRSDVWTAAGAEPREPLRAGIQRLIERERAERPSLGDARAGGVSNATAIALPPVVLVIDQVEELFTRFDAAERLPLWDGLVEAIDDEALPLRLVLALREDYLHKLDNAHPRLSTLLDYRFRLRGLSPFGARTAIVRPLVRDKIRYAPELVDRCAADLTEVPEGYLEEDGVVDPLLLQIVCSDVYRRAELRQPDAPSLTLDDYQATGGAEGVFRLLLSELFSGLESEEQLVLSLVLHEMTTALATKRPATVPGLLSSGLMASSDEVQALLDRLVAKKLVRRYETAGEPWYELVHDRLARALPAWLGRDPRFLRIRFMREVVRQLSRGLSEGVARATLLSKEQLIGLVDPFRSRLRFNADELLMLFRSAVATEHEVSFWSSAYEDFTKQNAAEIKQNAAEILLEMMSAPETERATLSAVGALQMSEPRIRAKCLERALYAKDVAARETATAALVKVAGDEEISSLQRALSNEKERPEALRVLAALLDVPSARVKISASDRKEAQRRDQRERIKQAKVAISLAGIEGMWEGARMAIWVASMIAIPGLVLVLSWLSGDEMDEFILVFGIFTIVLSALLGALWGRTVASALARRRAARRPISWLATLRGPIEAAVFLGTFIVIPAGTSAILLSDDAGLLAGIFLALGAACLCVTAISVRILEYVFAGTGWRALHTRLWIIAGSAPVPMMLWIVAGATLLTRRSDDGWLVLVYMAFTWVSCASAAISGALARVGHAGLGDTARPSSQRARRLALLGPTLAAVALLVVILREYPLKWWADVVDIDAPDAAVSKSFDRDWRSGKWLNVRTSGPQLIELRGGDDRQFAMLLSWGGTRPFWIKRAHFPVTFGAFREVKGNHGEIVDPESDVIDPKPNHFAIVKLAKSKESSAWNADLKLHFPTEPVLVWQAGCRLSLPSDKWECYNGGPKVDANCAVDYTAMRFAEAVAVPDGPSGGSAFGTFKLTCDDDDSGATGAQAVIAFMDPERTDVYRSQNRWDPPNFEMSPPPSSSPSDVPAPRP